MSKEILEASMHRLRGSLMETFEAIKDVAAAPAEENTVDKIAQLSSRLAALEGALLTLQQYAPAIEEQVRARRLEEAIAVARALQEEEEESSSEEAAPPSPLSEEELIERSPTYRRSMAQQKKKDEPKD